MFNSRMACADILRDMEEQRKSEQESIPRESMDQLKEKYNDSYYGAKIIQVIQIRTTTGKGTEGDPARPIFLYRSLDGELLAVYDPCMEIP